MEIPHRPSRADSLREDGLSVSDGAGGFAALSGNINSKLKTEMISITETAFYKEPTHDEIALHAFLAWQKDGSPQGTDFQYWIEAERRLRAQRQKQAEAAAAQAAKPWPPGARTVKTKSTTTNAASKPALASAGERANTVKVTRTATPRSPRSTTVKAAR